MSTPYTLLHLGIAAAIFTATYTFFQKTEENCSKEFRDTVAAWLANSRVSIANGPQFFGKVFDVVFGDRHFSFSCFIRSCVASVCCMIVALTLMAGFGKWKPEFFSVSALAASSVLRIAGRLNVLELFRYVLDVKEHPIRSIGLVSGLIFALFGWILSWL
jgi:hypothetical protein